MNKVFQNVRRLCPIPEVMMLVDVPVHKTAKELGVTRTSIYTEYTGLSPP
jgi:hypothetical protein